jgi:predicted nuclease of predicted toxin-antitoxin system
MAQLLIDEDLPRSLVPMVRSAGFSAEDVRDIGLRGQPDDEIIGYARTHGFAVLTADVGFGNLVRFPLGSHHGVVVARFPHDLHVSTLNATILAGLRELSDADIAGSLVIIEPGRIRLRRGP